MHSHECLLVVVVVVVVMTSRSGAAYMVGKLSDILLSVGT